MHMCVSLCIVLWMNEMWERICNWFSRFCIYVFNLLINQKYSREKNYWKHTNCHYSLNNNSYLHSLSIRYYKLSTDKSYVWDDVGRFWANTSSFRVRNLHTCRLWPQGSWKPPSRTLRKRVRWKWQLVSFEWWDFVAFKNVSLF